MERFPQVDLDKTSELVRGVAKTLQEGQGSALMLVKEGEMEAYVFVTTDPSFRITDLKAARDETA